MRTCVDIKKIGGSTNLRNCRPRNRGTCGTRGTCNLVPRVFRLFGQRGNAGKTLGTSKKFNFFDHSIGHRRKFIMLCLSTRSIRLLKTITSIKSEFLTGLCNFHLQHLCSLAFSNRTKSSLERQVKANYEILRLFISAKYIQVLNNHSLKRRLRIERAER